MSSEQEDKDHTPEKENIPPGVEDDNVSRVDEVAPGVEKITTEESTSAVTGASSTEDPNKNNSAVVTVSTKRVESADTATKEGVKTQKAKDKLVKNLEIVEVVISKGGTIGRKTLNKVNDVLFVRSKATEEKGESDKVVGPYTEELEKTLNDMKLKYFPAEKPVVKNDADAPKIEPFIGTKIKGTAKSTGVITQNIEYVEYELGLIQDLGRQVKLALDSVVVLDGDARIDFKKGSEAYMRIVQGMLRLKLDAKVLADKDISLVVAKQAIDELQTYIYQLKRMNDVMMAVLCPQCRKQAMWLMVTSLPQSEVAQLSEEENNQTKLSKGVIPQ